MYKTSKGITTVVISDKEEALQSDGSVEVTYKFSNNILQSITTGEPVYLYGGMQDNVDTSSVTEINSPEIADAILMRDDILIKLTEGFLSSKIDAKVDENTGKVSMDTGILFATDSAELSEASKAYVDAFCKVYAPVILNDEYKDAISQVVFEGHTDTAGEYDYNLELSQKRADAVLAYCLDSTANSLSDEQKTELKNLSQTKGYSFSDPVYDENGNVDMDACRRVEVKFYMKLS